MERISARSPFYVVAPTYNGSTTVEPLEVGFKVKIWEGDIVIDKPTAETYTYTKQPRYEGDTHIFIELSKQIQDYLIHQFQADTTVDYLVRPVFVEINVQTSYSGGVIDETNTYIALDAYGSYKQGLNYSFDDILINNNSISVLDGSTIRIPVITDGDSYEFQFRNNTTVLEDITVTSAAITDTENAVFIVDSIEAGINNVLIKNLTQVTEYVMDVELVTECIYTPIKCVFVNKQGVKQDLWFYKQSKESIKSDTKDYKANILTESMNVNVPILSYDSTAHQRVKYNTNSKKTIECNTGYIDEGLNVVVEEMINSEYVWLVIDDVVYPVDNKTQSQELMTKRNDQLIKYTFKFDYSFDEIQNVR